MKSVCIIVPVYNVAAYIERCARSLFEQDYENIDFVFIDDCTPDDSIARLLEVMKDYPKRKDRIVIHRMEKNSGQAVVRMWGLNNTHSDYVMHVDSDDWIDSNMVSSMVASVTSSDADIVFCNYYRSYESVEYPKVIAHTIDDKDSFFRDILSGKVEHFLWNTIIRRSLIDSIDFVVPTANSQEDFLLLLQLVHYAGTIGICDNFFYHYWYRVDSITSSSDVLEGALQFKGLPNFQLILQFLEQNNLEEKYSAEIIWMKFKERSILRSFLDDGKIYRLWKSIFPELERQLLWHPDITIRQKVIYLLSLTRLEPFYRRIYKLFIHE